MDNFQWHTEIKKLNTKKYILYDSFYKKSWTGQNYYMVLEIRLVAGCSGVGVEGWLQRDTKELSMEIKIFYILGSVVVKERYSFVKNHHSVHLKHMAFIACILYCNKLIFFTILIIWILFSSYLHCSFIKQI